MLDHVTPLQVPGRMADRQAEARAHRLAREAGGGDERTFWLTDGLRIAANARDSVLVRVRGNRVKARPVFGSAGHRP